LPEKELTPRQKQARESRQKIYDAAVELFDKKGYENVTIEQICEKAGFSTGNFYVYFKSKDQIIMEQFQGIDEYYEKIIADIPEEEDTIEKLRFFLAAGMRYVADLGVKMIRVIYYSQIGPVQKRKSYIVSGKRYLYKVTYSLVEEGQGRGEIRKDMDSHELAELIIKCHRGVIYDWCAKRGAYDLRKEGDRVFGLLLEGFRA
jgi:AcrR family transcriptional regulator